MTSAAIDLPPFVHEYLDKIAKSEGFFDYKIEQEAGSKHADGFTARLISTTIIGQRQVNGHIQQDQLTLICKIEPSGSVLKEQLNTTIHFEREVFAYKNLLPAMEKFQLEKGLTKVNGFFTYPKCYVAYYNAAEDKNIIIMNNLRVDGYELWNKLMPIPFEKAKLLLQQLGRYHGLSFVLRDQKPDLFNELKNGVEPEVMITMLKEPACEAIFQSSFDQAAKQFDDNCETGKVLQRIKEEWKAIFTRSVERNVAEPYTVLAHGDCWNNNLMFLNKNVS